MRRIGESLSIYFLHENSKTQPRAHIENKHSLSSLLRRSSKPDACPFQISQRAVLAEHTVLDAKISLFDHTNPPQIGRWSLRLSRLTTLSSQYGSHSAHCWYRETGMITAGLNEIWWKNRIIVSISLTSNGTSSLIHRWWKVPAGTPSSNMDDIGSLERPTARSASNPTVVSGIFPRLNSDVRVTFSHHIRRNKFDYSHTYTIITLLVSLNSELGDMNHRRRTHRDPCEIWLLYMFVCSGST